MVLKICKISKKKIYYNLKVDHFRIILKGLLLAKNDKLHDRMHIEDCVQLFFFQKSWSYLIIKSS